MCIFCKLYRFPRVGLLLIGLGVVVLLFGVANVAQADDQTNTLSQSQSEVDCGGCNAMPSSVDSASQSLVPNLNDLCDVCHTTTRSENKEDTHDQRQTEYRLYVTLTDIIAFKSEHSYLANDARLDSIVAQLNRAEHHLQLGDYERAMQLIDEANRLFDRLKIEAQRTMLLDRTGQSVMTLVAIHQTDTTSRFMSDVHLLVQSSLLLDIDNQECIVAIKRQVGFTVRTEHTLHRRVPLSDEEANVLFHFAHFIQRLPSSNARSLFVLLAG